MQECKICIRIRLKQLLICTTFFRSFLHEGLFNIFSPNDFCLLLEEYAEKKCFGVGILSCFPILFLQLYSLKPTLCSKVGEVILHLSHPLDADLVIRCNRFKCSFKCLNVPLSVYMFLCSSGCCRD